MTVPECFVDFVTLRDQPFAVPAVLSTRRGLTLTTVDTPPGCPCDAATLTQPREHFTTLLRSSIAAYSHAATVQLQRHAPSAVAGDDYPQHMLALMKRPRGVDFVSTSDSESAPFAAALPGAAPKSTDETPPLILQRFTATWIFATAAMDEPEWSASDASFRSPRPVGRRLALCDYATRWRLARYLLLARSLPVELVPNVLPLIAAYRVRVGNGGVSGTASDVAKAAGVSAEREDTYLLQRLPWPSLGQYVKDAASRPDSVHVRLIARELFEYLFVLHRGGVVAATLSPSTIFVDPTFSHGRASIAVAATGCFAIGEDLPSDALPEQHQLIFGFEGGAGTGSANAPAVEALALYRYSAPEVVLARYLGRTHPDIPATASPASDIWSLGAVLFELITRCPAIDLCSATANLSFVPVGPVVPSSAPATTAHGSLDASHGASLYRDLEAESAAVAAAHEAQLSTFGLTRVNRAFVAGSGQVEHYLKPPGQLCPPPLSTSLQSPDPCFASGSAAWPGASPPVLSGASSYAARAAMLNDCNAQTVSHFAAGTAQPVTPGLRYRAALEAAVGNLPTRMRSAFAAALPDAPSATQTLRAAVASGAGSMAATSPSTTAFMRTQRRAADEEARGPTGPPRIRRLLAESGADRSLCEVVESMLSPDPQGRPTVEDALRTLAPFFGLALTAGLGADGGPAAKTSSVNPTPLGQPTAVANGGSSIREGSAASLTSMRFRVGGRGDRDGASPSSSLRAGASQVRADMSPATLQNALLQRGVAVPPHATLADVRLLYAGVVGSESALARTGATALSPTLARGQSAPPPAASQVGSTSYADDLSESSWAIPWGTEPSVLQDVIAAMAPLMN